ncbi:hypothetical protein D5086_009033 [Populus alba]|uniref:Uncharacterized protein n=1 Tax=Populus alba TaxID=43335 RepID=A0ACC4CIR9_POPAL
MKNQSRFGVILLSMVALSSTQISTLSPEAPDQQYLPNSPIFSATNRNTSSYYYSTSGPSHSHPYPYKTNTDYEHPSNAKCGISHNHDLVVSTVSTKPSPILALSVQTQMVQSQDEPKAAEMQQVVIASVGTEAKREGTVADIMVLLMGEKEEMRGPVLPDGQDTTVMVRNIPNRYTYLVLRIALSLSPLVSMTVEGFFSSSSLLATRAAWKFCLSAKNQAWDVFQSNKIREIACARIQEQLVKRFEKSTFECDSDEYSPVCSSPGRDGSRAMVEQRTVDKCIRLRLGEAGRVTVQPLDNASRL